VPRFLSTRGESEALAFVGSPTFHGSNTIVETLASTEFFAAAFIDGYSRLTALAARQNFSVQAAPRVATVQ
jgi:precorrin-2 methylase